MPSNPGHALLLLPPSCQREVTVHGSVYVCVSLHSLRRAHHVPVKMKALKIKDTSLLLILIPVWEIICRSLFLLTVL